ncbi:MAG: hypothetical protein KKE11_02620 [Gammaproteobacteria bacterium]|nr:hypothetical protein [Gammaproteobacteria bacterium]
MKYVAISILIFITTNCFAINQKMIEGAEKYRSAIANLEAIDYKRKLKYDTLKSTLKDLAYEEDKTGLSRAENLIKYYRERTSEIKNIINDLGAEYIEAGKEVAKYKDINYEYEKQIEKEFKRERLKTTVLNVLGLAVFPILGLMIWLWGFIYIVKRNKRLFKEGKITQEDYNRMMKNQKSHILDEIRTNPATGLPMIGGCDSGGNPAGRYFDDGSRFDASRDYQDRHRWDAHDASQSFFRDRHF